MKPLTWIREGECIRCTSHALDISGYPRMVRNGKLKSIARHILTRRHGGIPGGMLSRHTCDNRWCIRPDHIVIGTIADNMQDRKERGGYDLRGEKNPHARFTETQVLQIREATGLQREIAKRFGIKQSQVSQIKLRKIWNHI